MAAVGTLTRTKSIGPAQNVYTYTLTTAAGGGVSGYPLKVRAGYLKSLEIIPSLTATQPTNLFDVTLLDENGADLLGNRGADLVNTGPTLLQFDPGVYTLSTLDLVVANGGASKVITAVLTVRDPD